MQRIGPKPGLTLFIGNPPQDGQINIGEALTITGLVGGRVGAEPVVPESVTVQLADLQLLRATLKPPRFPQRDTAAPNWTFTAVYDSVNVPPGPTAISATASFSSNEDVTLEQTVFASLGGTPLDSTFTTTDVTVQTSAAGTFSRSYSAQ
jgi:hypothetical protein